MLSPERTGLAALALVFSAAACSDAPTQVTESPLPGAPGPALSQDQGDPPDVQRAEVSGVFDNPCSGEEIAWSGEVVFVFRFVSTPEEGHVLDLLQLHATGTGLDTGDAYTLAQAGGLHRNGALPEGPLVFHEAIPTIVVNTTSGGVFQGRIFFHVTRTPDGEARILVNRVEFECRAV